MLTLNRRRNASNKPIAPLSDVNLFDMIEESLQKIASTQPYVQRLISRPSGTRCSSQNLSQHVQYQAPNETKLYLKYTDGDSVRLMAKFRANQIQELRKIKDEENKANELHRYSTDLFESAVKRVDEEDEGRPSSTYKMYRQLSNLSSKSNMSAYVLPIKDISHAQPDVNTTKEKIFPDYLPERMSIRRKCLNEVRLKSNPTPIRYAHDHVAREIIWEGELVSNRYTVPRLYQGNAYSWQCQARPQLKDIANKLKTLYVTELESSNAQQGESFLESFQETTLDDYEVTEEMMEEEVNPLGDEEMAEEQSKMESEEHVVNPEEKKSIKGKKKRRKKKESLKKVEAPAPPPKSPTLSSVSAQTKRNVHRDVQAVKSFMNDYKKEKQQIEKMNKAEEDGIEESAEGGVSDEQPQKEDVPPVELESGEIKVDEKENEPDQEPPPPAEEEEEEIIPNLPDFACPSLPDKSRHYETRKWLHEKMTVVDLYPEHSQCTQNMLNSGQTSSVNLIS